MKVISYLFGPWRAALGEDDPDMNSLNADGIAEWASRSDVEFFIHIVCLKLGK